MYYQQAALGGRGDMGYHHAAAADYDRKRTLDVLNEFFGDAKRRELDPASYQQVGQRLMPLHGNLPGVHSGAIPAEYVPAPPPPAAVPVGAGGGGAATGAPPHGPYQQHYALPPMPNLRTKNDLVQIDNILEQMQSTVYENSNNAAAAGVHQPGSHYLPLGFRHSQSPPQAAAHAPQPAVSQGGYSAAHVASPLTAISSTHSNGTPAVTPPSSSMSYTSGHSPSASSSGMSPTSRHSSTTSALYPTLPAVTSGYPGQSTTSTLGPSFDADPRRRYSGGMLQRASGATSRPAVEREGSTTPKAVESAVSSVSSPSVDSEAEHQQDQAYESWLENVRVIEYLREYVIDRLKKGEYEPEAGAAAAAAAAAAGKSSGSSTSSPPRSPMDTDADSPTGPPAQPAYPALPSA